MPENLYLGKRKDYIFPVDWRLSSLCVCVCVQYVCSYEWFIALYRKGAYCARVCEWGSVRFQGSKACTNKQKCNKPQGNVY